MATKKLSPDLHTEILVQSARGGTNRAIAEWLLAEHGVKISHQAVGRFLKETHVERGEVATEVTRAHLAPKITADLDRLEEIRAEAERRADIQENDEVWCKLAKVEADIIDRKLKFSGADEASERPAPRIEIVYAPSRPDGDAAASGVRSAPA